VTPFDLIETDHYSLSPFSVPCPHCGHIEAYKSESTKLYPWHTSHIAVEYGGGDHDALEGTLFGRCQYRSFTEQKNRSFCDRFGESTAGASHEQVTGILEADCRPSFCH
jgi:hypothetical protein